VSGIILWTGALLPAPAPGAAPDSNLLRPADTPYGGEPAGGKAQDWLLAIAYWLSYGGEPTGGKAQVQFDHASEFCAAAFKLRLSTPFPGAAIFYTTNGATPAPAAGIRYEGPIPITGTAIVRAAAFEEETALTDAAARTYLFVPDLLRETGQGWPKAWGTNEGKPVLPHYRMSAGLSDEPASRQAVVEGLHSLPALSIITDQENLFAPETGIYAHPTERGVAWERPASVELICPAGGAGFGVNCGLRIHGGSSRRPEESPKHSFRLVFKPRYGPSKLRFPLFGPGGPEEFESLILRAGNNDSWLHPDGQARRRAAYVRDEWMRASLRAMGYPCVCGCFVQVYLNGRYWGLYNLCERPGAALLPPPQGGPAPEFDARKAGKIEAGDQVAWDQMMALANAGLEDPRHYEVIGQCLDLVELADYLILNFYAGNADWDRWANWYAARPRTPGGKFRFSVWDAECTLGDLGACAIDRDDDQSPLRLFQKLSENAEFRVLFADRAQRLLFNDGPLAPGPAAERFRALAKAIEKAIAAEAARWGDYRQAVNRYKTGPYERYTPKDHWQPEINRILTRYFPQRAGLVLDQFRERGLFPPAEAPTARRHGSTLSLHKVEPPSHATHAGAPKSVPARAPAPDGADQTIYYTLDGSDPRRPGGTLSPDAIQYDHPITMSPGQTIKARVRLRGSGRPQWSALVEAHFARP